jgi:hypothetical protein
MNYYERLSRGKIGNLRFTIYASVAVPSGLLPFSFLILNFYQRLFHFGCGLVSFCRFRLAGF